MLSNKRGKGAASGVLPKTHWTSDNKGVQWGCRPPRGRAQPHSDFSSIETQKSFRFGLPPFACMIYIIWEPCPQDNQMNP